MDSIAPLKFVFYEAVAITISRDSQQEIDYYWNALSKDGEEGPCGWLKD
ncbi:VOC family protein [Pollutibacter soli]